MKLPTIEGPPGDGDESSSRASRLLWFAALWVGGLAAVAAVAYGLRALIL